MERATGEVSAEEGSTKVTLAYHNSTGNIQVMTSAALEGIMLKTLTGLAGQYSRYVR